jgi:hypothetical protein
MANKRIGQLTAAGAAADTDKLPIENIAGVTQYVTRAQLVAGISVADADATTKGKVQLAGALGGTAAAPTALGHADAASLAAALAVKAPLDGPVFTGNPQAPTQAGGNSSTSIATTAFVQAAIAALVGSAPAALNALDELAAALGNDANFATTVTTLIGTKQAAIQFYDDGAALGSAGTATEFDITGPGITASRVGNKVTAFVPSGGGATVVVQEDDVTVVAAAATINLTNGFDVSESPSGEALVALDLGEYTGTDLPVASGGTGASTASGARTNLGLVIGTDVAPVANAVFTGTTTLGQDPALAMQAATKQYVDSIALNLGKRQRVRVGTTANVTIATALNNGDVIDGVTLSTGDLVLVKNQAAPAENGVYVVGVTPARSTEFDTFDEHPGSMLVIAEGTTNADTVWLCTSNQGGTLGTTDLVFAQSGSNGALLAANNLSDLANAATARTNLGVAIGTNVQAFAASVSQAEAEGGTETALRMWSPERVAQAIAALGGSGATVTAKEGGATIGSVTAFDFGAGFDLTESPAGQANIVLDLTEYNAGALPIAGGGTGATTASAARTALGAAASANAVFTGTVTLGQDPATGLEAATKQYVDSLAINVGKRTRVRVATTANIATLATGLNNDDTIDGVALVNGDLVLVKNQTTASQNGVYVVGASPARASEFDTWDEHPGSLIAVAEGTTNGDTLWLCTSNTGGTLGTTSLAFSKMVIAGELLAANNLSDVASTVTAFNTISPSTTKGDLIVHDGTNDVRLPVGQTNYVLTADSAQGTGIKWAPAPSAANPVVRSVTGTTDTLVVSDAGNFIDYTNAGAISVSLTTAFNGLSTTLTWPTGAGTITITQTGTTIDGSSAAVVLSSQAGAFTLIPIGTNAFRGVGSVGDLVASDISDSTTVGRAVLMAASAAAARSAIGAAPLDAPVFTTSVTLPGDPSSALHAVTKQYVDGIAANLGKRARVRAATTANITIATALNNGDTLDGVTLATGDQVLVKNQTTSGENGVYVVGTSPARAAEFDSWDEHPGTLIAVAEGTANNDTVWLCTANFGGTLGTTAITYSQITTGGGTVTATGGPLTNDAILAGAGGTDTKVASSITSSAAGQLSLGTAGSVSGKINFRNDTSGSLTLQPQLTGALGTAVLTLPTATDVLVGRVTTDTLQNKTLTAPVINGGTADALTALTIRSSGSGAFDLGFVNTENLTADRNLTITLNDAARTINLGGNITTAGALATAGANSLTLTTTGSTNVTLPTSGTLAKAAQAAGLTMFCPSTTAANGTYVLIGKARYAFTITEVTGKTSSGTCTVQVTIDGTNVTGGSVSVTSTEASSTATAANAVAAGQTVAVVVSSNSSATDLWVDIGATRTLD